MYMYNDMCVCMCVRVRAYNDCFAALASGLPTMLHMCVIVDPRAHTGAFPTLTLS